MTLCLLFAVQHQEGTHKNTERRDSGSIQCDQHAGNGGTDVGTQDNAGGLSQIHDTGIDKAHGHNGGCGGGLDHHGNQQTYQKAQNRITGQLFQQILHAGTGSQCQAVAHVLHAEQEHT